MLNRGTSQDFVLGLFRKVTMNVVASSIQHVNFKMKRPSNIAYMYMIYVNLILQSSPNDIVKLAFVTSYNKECIQALSHEHI